jgi:hypothetical protein
MLSHAILNRLTDTVGTDTTLISRLKICVVGDDDTWIILISPSYCTEYTTLI